MLNSSGTKDIFSLEAMLPPTRQYMMTMMTKGGAVIIIYRICTLFVFVLVHGRQGCILQLCIAFIDFSQLFSGRTPEAVYLLGACR
jgi:hypothetical protein